MKFIHALLISISISTFLTLPMLVSAGTIEEIQRMAEQGDVKSQSHLGYLYYVGEGVPQDYSQAVKWYDKAAAQGDRDAQYNLAVAYAFGEGIKQDLGKAATWYRRAAEQSHKIAQYSLGLSYIYGEGVPQDSKQAAFWFEKSALQGYSRAQVHLASMYHIGDGIEQNYTKAVNWYRKAADRGDQTAQYNLGSLYRSGKGVEQSLAQAKRWFRLAADQGYAPAQNELASLSFKPVHSEQTKPAIEKPVVENTQTDIPGTESNQTAVASNTKATGAAPETSAIRTTNTPEEETKVAEATTSEAEREVTIIGGRSDDLRSASDLTNLSSNTSNEERATDSEESGGIAGFFKNIFAPVENETQLEVTEVDEEPSETVYIAQEDSVSREVTVEKTTTPASSPDPVVETATIEEKKPDNIVPEVEIAETDVQQEETLTPAETNIDIEETDEAITQAPEEVAETKVEQESQGVAGFFNKLFGKEPSDNSLADADVDDSTVYHSQHETAYIKPVTNIDTADAITSSGTENNVVETPQEIITDESNEKTPVAIAEVDDDLDTNDEQTSEQLNDEELLTGNEDDDKSQGIGGFFNRLFGGNDKEKEELASVSDDTETIYHEQHQQVSSEVKDYIDDIEKTEIAEVDTSDSDNTNIQVIEPAKSLQPPPVTDVVINYENQISAGEKALQKENFEEALKLFRPAAIQGNPTAQSYMASMYYTGDGVPQDYTQAFNWYRRAAEQGDVTSQYSLGNMYLLGEGVEQDNRLAYGWYKMAAAQGHINAQNNVTSLEQGFSQEKAVAETENSLPGFIDDLFKPEKTTANKEEIASSKNNKTLAKTPARTDATLVPAKTNKNLVPARNETAIKEETSSVATVYPLEDSGTPAAEQEIVYLDDSVSSETNAPEIVEAENTAPQGELFDQLFNSDQEQTELAAKQEDVDSPAPLEENFENESISKTDAVVEESSPTKEDESSLVSFFDRIFNEKKTETTTEKESSVQPVDNTKGLIVQAPAEPAVEIEKPTSVDDFETDKPELNAIHSNAVQGDSRAQYELANIFYQGKGIPQDYSQAFIWYRRAAQQGEKDAQYTLGNMYLMGEGVNQNDQEAMRWYQLAADQGHEAARHNFENLEKMPVIVMTEEEPVPQASHNPFESNTSSSSIDNSVADSEDPVEDMTQNENVEEAEEAGPGFFGSLKKVLGFNNEDEKIPADNELNDTEQTETVYIDNSNIIAEEDVVEYSPAEDLVSTPEPSEAVAIKTDEEKIEAIAAVEEETNEEASQSDAEYNYQQGLAFTYGDNVPMNHKKAFEHFFKAAEAGHVTAQYRVATAYAYGEGVGKNQEKAAEWYEKAATKGDPLAQRQLAMLYWSGKGVTRDKAMAHAWYSIIADNGNIMDKQRLDHIQQEMTSEELNESKRIANSLNTQ